jgi:hypothetical protein
MLNQRTEHVILGGDASIKDEAGQEYFGVLSDKQFHHNLALLCLRLSKLDEVSIRCHFIDAPLKHLFLAQRLNKQMIKLQQSE